MGTEAAGRGRQDKCAESLATARRESTFLAFRSQALNPLEDMWETVAEDAGVDRMDPRHRQMAEQRAALSRRPSLRTSAAAEPITISFSDAETFCTGMLNQFAGSLEGVVKQLKFGDDGCWEVSDMATHRFSLQVLQEVSDRACG